MVISPFAQTSIDSPAKIALISQGQPINYQGLFQIIQSVALQLKKAGLVPQSRLACIGPNNFEMIVLYWACLEADLLFFPISPRFPLGQTQQICVQFAVDSFWSLDPRYKLDQIKPIQLDFSTKHSTQPRKIDVKNPANLILTSGSSGSPKAAVHSLGNHIASAAGAASVIPLNAGDRWLLSLPLFHIGGLAIINRCALAGATVVIRDDQMQLAEQLQQDCVSHLSLVEAQLLKLLYTPSGLAKVKYLLLGGGAISKLSLNALALRNIQAYTSYGMTEMSSQITTAIANPDGSSGTLLPKRQLRIQDGVVQVAGECLFLGYVNDQNPKADLILPLTDDGWFDTQDKAETTLEGNLKILGRADNMFICGGENIQPEEVENALKLLPQVDDVIVFGLDDDQFGNLPAAIIKLNDSDPTLELATFDQHLAAHIARFKRPRQYFSWPESITNTGLKVQRKLIIKYVKQNLKKL